MVLYKFVVTFQFILFRDFLLVYLPWSLVYDDHVLHRHSPLGLRSVCLSLSLSLLAHGDRGCLAQRQRNVHPHPFFASGLHSNETYNFIQSYKWASLDLDCGDSNFKIDAWAYCRSVLWLMRVARLESLDEGKQLSHRPIVCWVYDTLQHTTWNWVSGCVQNGL